MTKSTTSPIDHTKYYFYHDATRVIYFSENYPNDPDMIYIGTSDNPNPKMAAAVFMRNNSVTSGFTIREMK